MSTDMTAQDRYVELVRESQGIRGAIRDAADDGNVEEVERLLLRARDLEIAMLALRYTKVRHARATNRRAHWGYSPDLDAVESELSALLARIGVVHHTRA